MENKLKEGELVEQMKRCWHLYSLPAINSVASEIVKLQEQQKPTVSREEKEGMIKMFEEMCMFMAVRGFIREDERAVNIKKLPDGLEVTNGE